MPPYGLSVVPTNSLPYVGERLKIAHFTEKGQTELPFVESRYKEILTQQGEEAAKEYLTGYTADFAGATMLRWREMGDSFWTQFERGF